jgi:hypothetical protein
LRFNYDTKAIQSYYHLKQATFDDVLPFRGRYLLLFADMKVHRYRYSNPYFQISGENFDKAKNPTTVKISFYDHSSPGDKTTQFLVVNKLEQWDDLGFVLNKKISFQEYTGSNVCNRRILKTNIGMYRTSGATTFSLPDDTLSIKSAIE